MSTSHAPAQPLAGGSRIQVATRHPQPRQPARGSPAEGLDDLTAKLGYDPDAHLNSKIHVEGRRTPGFKQLKAKLLAVAPGRVVPMPEPYMDELLARGAVVTGRVRKQKSPPNACHYNSALRWLKDPRATLYCGYYYHDSKNWIQHSWNVRGTEILDRDDDALFYFGTAIADPAFTAITDFFCRWSEASPAIIRRAIRARLQQRITDVMYSLFNRIDFDADDTSDFEAPMMTALTWWNKVRFAQGADAEKPIDMSTLFDECRGTP